jgi:hypothetical protein
MRPDVGSDGKPIQLLANFFKIDIDATRIINHYHVEINFVQKRPSGEEKLIEAKRDNKQ